MRIVSLVPSATEMLFALGLGDEVTAVTHECDHPAAALEPAQGHARRDRPRARAGEIDRAVRELTEQGQAIYELDEAAAARAAARPDRHPGAVRGLRGLLRRRARGGRADGPAPGGDLARPAHARRGARRRAHARRRRPTRKDAGVDLVQDAAARIDRVRLAVRGRRAGARRRARVARPGVRRRPLDAAADRVRRRRRRARPARRALRGRARWEEVAAARPEVVVVMPCGYDAERALEEAYDYADELEALGAERIVAVDAAAYFSRPGPRLSTASSCSATCCTPTACPRRRPSRSRWCSKRGRPSCAPRSTCRRARSPRSRRRPGSAARAPCGARPRG